MAFLCPISRQRPLFSPGKMECHNQTAVPGCCRLLFMSLLSPINRARRALRWQLATLETATEGPTFVSRPRKWEAVEQGRSSDRRRRRRRRRWRRRRRRAHAATMESRSASLVGCSCNQGLRTSKHNPKISTHALACSAFCRRCSLLISSIDVA